MPAQKGGKGFLETDKGIIKGKKKSLDTLKRLSRVVFQKAETLAFSFQRSRPFF